MTTTKFSHDTLQFLCQSSTPKKKKIEKINEVKKLTSATRKSHSRALGPRGYCLELSMPAKEGWRNRSESWISKAAASPHRRGKHPAALPDHPRLSDVFSRCTQRPPRKSPPARIEFGVSGFAKVPEESLRLPRSM